MVVGSGMIAREFASYAENPEVVIYASGVSNSQEVNPNKYKREYDLVNATLDEHSNKIFVYFSTCSVDDPSQSEGMYIKHKLSIEQLIKMRASRFYIFRLSQVVGKTSSPTIVNAFYEKIRSGEHFTIWANAVRNLIDVEDVYKISNFFITQKLHINRIINISSSLYVSPVEIVSIIESILNKKANYSVIQKGARFLIDNTISLDVADRMGIKFDEGYNCRLLKKYCKPCINHI